MDYSVAAKIFKEAMSQVFNVIFERWKRYWKQRKAKTNGSFFLIILFYFILQI